MHVLSYWQDLAPLLYAFVYSLWLSLLGYDVKCHITPLVLHQEHKNYCSFRKMWKWLLCFSCVANRLHNRATDWGRCTRTTVGFCLNWVHQHQLALSKWVLNISRDGDPTASLCTCSSSLSHSRGYIFSWYQSQNFLFQIVSIAFHPSSVHLSKGSGSVFSKLSLAHNSCSGNRKEKQNIGLACPHGTRHLAGSIPKVGSPLTQEYC